MQEVDGGPRDKASKTAEAPLLHDETAYPLDAALSQESTSPETDASTGCDSSCIVRVVIESSDAGMEEVVSSQVDAAETFSTPADLQQTQMVVEEYESTVDMGGIIEDGSGNKI